MTRTLDLNALHLASGGHDDPDDGLCLLEAVAFMAGEPHSDHPACVSPVLGAFGRELNDRLDDSRRQKLKPLIPGMAGTAGDGLDEARGYLALDWLIRTYTPAWLDLAGLTAEAAELRALRRIVDLSAAEAAGPVVRSSADKARAARAAARDAARDAAGAAAGAAARDAAGAAAWDAARDAARAAARAAARDALKPTVEQLQDSAIELFTRMVKPAPAQVDDIHQAVADAGRQVGEDMAVLDGRRRFDQAPVGHRWPQAEPETRLPLPDTAPNLSGGEG